MSLVSLLVLTFILEFALAAVILFRYFQNKNDYVLVLGSGFLFSSLSVFARVLFGFFPKHQFLFSIYQQGSAIFVSGSVVVVLLMILAKKEKSKPIVIFSVVFSFFWLFFIGFYGEKDAVYQVRTILLYGITFLVLLLSFITYFRYKHKGAFLFVGGIVAMALGGILARFNENLLFLFLNLGFILVAVGILFFGKKKGKKGKALFGEIPLRVSKIGPRIIGSILALAALCIGLGSGLYYLFTIDYIEKIGRDHLETVVVSRADYLEEFLNLNQNIADRLLREESINEILSLDKTNSTDRTMQIELAQKIKAVVDVNSQIKEINLLDDEGTVIESSNRDNINQNNEIKLDRFGYIFSKGVDFKPELSFLTPIEEENELLGYLEMEINLEGFYRVLTERPGLGETGDIFLINDEGYFLSPSRFLENTFLELTAESINAKSCLMMLSEGTKDHSVHEPLEPFLGYNGNMVLGAHTSIIGPQWCLLAQIDREEIISSYRNQLLISILLLSLLLFSIVSVVGYYLARSVSRPLLKLQKGVSEIEHGNPDYSVEMDSKDEVGELSRAFGNMTKALKESREKIEQKVESRTQKLVEKQKVIKQTQMATLNILEDVQEERDKVAYEKKRVDRIIQSIGDGLFVTDIRGNIVLFNPMAEKISGFSKKEVLGKKYSKVLKFEYLREPDKKVNFVERALQLKTVFSLEKEIDLIMKNGKKIPVADSVAPILSGKEAVGAIVIFRNKTAEREIDRMKSNFVSIVSHQLRTPLSAIKWLLEMILDEEYGKLNPEQKNGLRDVFDSNERLIKLVNDLLRVSRLESSRVEVSPKKIDICKLINDVIEFQKINAKAHKCEFKLRYDPADIPKIKVDPVLVRSIIENLFSNAIEYTNIQRKNIITVSIEKKQKDLLISVADMGIGILANEQKRIFEMFFRSAGAVLLRPEGSGLGLYIVKMLVELSGGEIWLESEEGKGTTIYFTLPLEGSKKRKGERKLSD